MSKITQNNYAELTLNEGDWLQDNNGRDCLVTEAGKNYVIVRDMESGDFSSEIWREDMCQDGWSYNGPDGKFLFHDHFRAGGEGADPTGRVLPDGLQSTHQEWAETGALGAIRVKAYWIFENSEVAEDGTFMPFDSAHLDRLEVLPDAYYLD